MSATKFFVDAARRASQGSRDVNVSQAKLEGWGLRDVCLRPYQLDGVRWLAEKYFAGHGCILGDEMGLGKTLQVEIIILQATCADLLYFMQSIALLVFLHRHVGKPGPFLVLVPLSVVKNWESELSRFDSMIIVSC